MCTFGAGDRDGYCPALEAKGIDGLAFGGKWEIDTASTDFYCLGFHYEEQSDTFTCARETSSGIRTYYCADNYTVSETYFTTGVFECWEDDGGYGLYAQIWYDSHWELYTTYTDFATRHGFRFIAQNENDGLRYAAGDEIDMFFLDYNLDKFTDNAGFVLAGSLMLASTAACSLILGASLL